MKGSNKKAVLIGTVVLAILAAVFAAVYLINRPSHVAGEKNITIEVIGSKGKTTDYELATDAGFLKQAMDELTHNGSGFRYTGNDSGYGFMVDTINGEWARYDKDGTYWALYVNGEFGQYVADQQPVSDGDKFTWKYERSQ